MKEVCIINYTSNAAVYGIGTYIRELVYCLTNLGCQVIMVELGTDVKKPEFYVKEDRNVRTLHFPYLLKGEVDRYNKGVYRLLRLYLEDSANLVFHLQFGHSVSLLDSLKEYFPLSKSFFTIHYLYWSATLQGNIDLYKKIIHNQDNEKIKTKYSHIIDNFNKEKASLEKFDRIVCLSDDTHNLIQKQYGIKQNVWLIPNGLRENESPLSEVQKKVLREKFLIRPDEKVFLFVGRIDPIKGIEQLMSAFEDVVIDYPNCRLVVVGAGDINELLRKYNKACPKVSFTGKLDRKTLYQWYRIADIALFPSFYEECSFVGIEMMMHGLPIIASDGYSVKNMFQEGSGAQIARIEKPGIKKRYSTFEKNLKEGMTTVLKSDSLQAKLRKEALQSFHARYSIKRMQANYAQLLQSL